MDCHFADAETHDEGAAMFNIHFLAERVACSESIDV